MFRSVLTLFAVAESLTAAVALAVPASSSVDGLLTPAEAMTGELKPGQVVTVAGFGDTGWGEDGPDARGMFLGERLYVEAAPDGAIYLTDPENKQLRILRTDGSIGTVLQPDDLRTDQDATAIGGIAPTATAVAADGTVYVAASNGIHRLDADGTPELLVRATPVEDRSEPPEDDAWLGQPRDLDVDPDGNLVVIDSDRERILRIDAEGGDITTIAGGGDAAIPDSDGAAATDAALVSPRSVAVDSTGAVYLVQSRSDSEEDRYHPVVRRVDPDGAITTVTGANEVGDSGDGGPAAQARLGDYVLVAVAADDTLLIADRMNGRVRSVSADGTIATVAAAGGAAGMPAGAGPDLTSPYDVAPGPNGDLFVTGRARVARVDAAATPIVGECVAPGAGDDPDPWADEEPGAVVTISADMAQPMSVAVDSDGTLLVTDYSTGTVSTIGDDGEITALPSNPLSLIPGGMATAVLSGTDGTRFVASGGRIVKVYPDGSEVLVSGSGMSTGQVDDEAAERRATAVELSVADMTCVDGAVVLADARSGGLYRLAPDGTLSAVADHVTDTGGFDIRNGIAAAGDTVYAVVTSGEAPDGHSVVAIDGDGERRIVAGGGVSDSDSDGDGDGGPATSAALVGMGERRDVAVDADGTLYVSTGSGIRRIGTDGVIDTVHAPIGAEDDGTEDDVAESPLAAGLAFDAHGNLYFVAPEDGVVGVIVRPGEITEPFAWIPIAAGGTAVVALAGGVLLWRRQRRQTSADGSRLRIGGAR